MSEKLIAQQQTHKKAPQSAAETVAPAFQSVIWQPSKNLPSVDSQPTLSSELTNSSAALSGKLAFKRSSRVLNESFSFGKKAAKSTESRRKNRDQKEKLQNSLASLVFSRQESQVFELSQDAVDRFPPLSVCKESFETTAQVDASRPSTASSAQTAGLSFAQIQQSKPRAQDHLFVAGREVVLSDVFEEDTALNQPVARSGVELAKSYLEDRLEKVQSNAKRLQVQILDLKEENAALLHKLRQSDEESADLRAQLENYTDAISKAQSLQLERDQYEQVMLQLEKQKEAHAAQTQRLEQALRESDDLKVAAFKSQTESERRNLQLGKATAKLEEVSRQNLFLKEEIDEMKARYNLLSRKLVGQLKMSETQLRDIVVQSKHVQTEFVEDFYYRQKCKELEEQVAELQNSLCASNLRHDTFKSKAISDCQQFQTAFAQSGRFVASVKLFMSEMLEQFRILFNFDNWSKTREEQFCFPSIQMLASTFKAFSKIQAAAFWKLVDLNNVLDFVAFLSRSEAQPMFASLIHSKHAFLLAWDQSMERELKHSVIKRYEKYYELVQENELSARCDGLSAKQFLTDDADHPLTVWIMSLFFFWMSDGTTNLEAGALVLRFGGFRVLEI